MHQSKYSFDILRKVNMHHHNLAKTPSEIDMKLEKDGNENQSLEDLKSDDEDETHMVDIVD